MKTPVPDDLNKKMNMWRNGLTTLPKGYIEFHQKLAEADLASLKNKYIILGTFMADDGWLDGMKFLHATVEDKATGKLELLKWADCQEWYRRCPSGGWALIFRKELEPTPVPSTIDPEQAYEMRAAFGPGVDVVNVITGEKHRT